MANIILGELEEIDLRKTIEKINVLESINQLTPNAADTSEAYILTTSEENFNEVLQQGNNIFMPVTELRKEHFSSVAGGYVYFSLENYPFFKKISEIVMKEVRQKGVFRFRRTVKQNENILLIVSDLYVLSLLFGEPGNVVVKHANDVTPYHMNLMINFSGGTMAHLEYTFSDMHDKLIELDWSGIKKVIEFNSKEMAPIKPENYTSLPLTYNVESILATAHKLDRELIDRLYKLSKLIEGSSE